MKNAHKILLTPGPLTTSTTVKESMLIDIGTRDSDFNELVQSIRSDLLSLAHAKKETYTVVLLPGSGTYGVESVLTSVISKKDKVLILENGAYGKRMADICQQASIPYQVESFSMIQALPIDKIEQLIAQADITHVAFIHCETTAGVLNNLSELMKLVHKYQKKSIVDAMSSFASVEINMDELAVDYLITSSNKCLHGVPGIAIVYAKKDTLATCKGICKSLSLDLYAQYQFMEQNDGGFRFTSPTHVLWALQTAIKELKDSGGIPARNLHYQQLQTMIQDTMHSLGFKTLVNKLEQSFVITTFLIPNNFDFNDFYHYMKEHDFLLYSGKLPSYDAFRIGNIGEVTKKNIEDMLELVITYKKEHTNEN